MKQLIKFYFPIIALAIWVFTSCDTNIVNEVTLDQNNLTMFVGDKIVLSADVDFSGSITPSIIWTSNDETVATVSSTGEISALKGGAAIITATAGEKSAMCEVTVSNELKPVFDKASIEYWGDYYYSEVSNNCILYLTNNSDTLYLEINTSLNDSTGIPAGKYVMLNEFDSQSEFLPFTLLCAFETQDGDGAGSWFFNKTIELALETGELDVSVKDNEYTFTYSFVDFNGLKVSGSFKGAAEFNDYSEEMEAPAYIKASKVGKLNANTKSVRIRQK
ncbi:MAG: Ig-like domain-containing protein [Paludibacteraceae bacterium]|nr:Ig-like domain-containing protein [Paludibacteraceae bacterium]